MISRIVPIQGAIRALCRAKQVCCPPQAREVGFDPAQQLRVLSGRISKSHDRGAYSRARESWSRIKDWFEIYLERTISIIVRIQGAVRLLCRANQVFCSPEAPAASFDPAQQLHVVSGRETNSHDIGAYSRARECWSQMGDKRRHQYHQSTVCKKRGREAISSVLE